MARRSSRSGRSATIACGSTMVGRPKHHHTNGDVRALVVRSRTPAGMRNSRADCVARRTSAGPAGALATASKRWKRTTRHSDQPATRAAPASQRNASAVVGAMVWRAGARSAGSGAASGAAARGASLANGRACGPNTGGSTAAADAGVGVGVGAGAGVASDGRCRPPANGGTANAGKRSNAVAAAGAGGLPSKPATGTRSVNHGESATGGITKRTSTSAHARWAAAGQRPLRPSAHASAASGAASKVLPSAYSSSAALTTCLPPPCRRPGSAAAAAVRRGRAACARSGASAAAPATPRSAARRASPVGRRRTPRARCTR